MTRSAIARVCAAAVVLTACFTSVNAAATPPVSAVALPPLDFVSQLDLECFQTEPYQPRFPGPVVIEHLNPVLERLPRDVLELGEREQLCAPVAKNDRWPPREVLEFVQYVDLACYRARGHAVDFRLVLGQLNPQLADGTQVESRMVEPEQLCLPVIKNGHVPPDEVLRLVQYIDLLCYREENRTPLDRGLMLSQLNPEFRDVLPVDVHVRHGVQLCVPVRKDGQDIPEDVLRIVRWIDLEKFEITLHEPRPGIDVVLRHINPLYADLPEERASLRLGTHLMLPVAKNGVIPPPR